MEEFIGYVYALIDGTCDFEYVGQTTKTVEERFNQHAKANTRIGYAIRARGKEMFVVAVLKVCTGKDELDFWERHFIKSRNTKAPNGYNLTDGGEGVVGWTDEMRARVSEANTGKKRTLEQRANISAAQIKRFKDPAEREKISESKRGEKHPNYGKPRSPETLEKISEAHKGKTFTPEHCAHISEAKKGTHATDETRERMSEVRRGKKLNPRSAEDCYQIGAGQRVKSPYKNLIAELDARQMSYADLAKLMGLEKKSLARKIRGVRSFTDSDQKKLAEIFDKPIEYLLERDD